MIEEKRLTIKLRRKKFKHILVYALLKYQKDLRKRKKNSHNLFNKSLFLLIVKIFCQYDVKQKIKIPPFFNVHKNVG